MSGHLSGVAAKFLEESSIAFPSHCANHRLGFSLKGCATESQIIEDTLAFVRNLATFIRQSPQRMASNTVITDDLQPDSESTIHSIHKLCPTAALSALRPCLHPLPFENF